MKHFKLLIFAFLIITTLSCNKDKTSTNPQNLIVGTWRPIKEVDVCSTGSEYVSNYSACEQNEIVTFSSDGKFNDTGRFNKNQNGYCVGGNPDIGTWVIFNGNLSITITSFGETYNPTFFEVTNNTLRIGYLDNDSNNTCDSSNIISHYYTEFVRK